MEQITETAFEATATEGTTNPAAENQTTLQAADANEYDYYILVDRSGSMGKDSKKFEGRTRWQEAAEFTESLARHVQKFDEDGITLITFDNNLSVYDGVTADAVGAVFTNEQPRGTTDLGLALNKAFEMKFAKGKRSIMLVLTDGQPDSETAVVNSIIDAANRIERDEDLAIQFIQIGDDAEAEAFLKRLDDDLQKQGAKFDIVNSLTREQAQGFTVEELLWQALND